MLKPGDTIQCPITGDRFVIRARGASPARRSCGAPPVPWSFTDPGKLTITKAGATTD